MNTEYELHLIESTTLSKLAPAIFSAMSVLWEIVSFFPMTYSNRVNGHLVLGRRCHRYFQALMETHIQWVLGFLSTLAFKGRGFHVLLHILLENLPNLILILTISCSRTRASCMVARNKQMLSQRWVSVRQEPSLPPFASCFQVEGSPLE